MKAMSSSMKVSSLEAIFTLSVTLLNNLHMGHVIVHINIVANKTIKKNN
jgi:hypothetical protein